MNYVSSIKYYVLGIVAVILTTFYLIPNTVYSQSFDVAYVYDLADKDAVSGDIIVNSADGLVRATKGYDSRIFGVVQPKAAIIYKRVDGTGTPISRGGVATVNITTLNGPIKKGDYITTSEIAGKGQRSGLSGYTIGIALQDFDGTTGDKVQVNIGEETKEAVAGQIQVAVKIDYVEFSTSRSLGRTFDYLNNTFFKNVQDPEKFTSVVKYMAAAIAVFFSFIFAFFTFSRSIPKAMEAIGRNPLAANSIRFSIILNIVFILLSCLVGIVAAVIIIKV